MPVFRKQSARALTPVEILSPHFNESGHLVQRREPLIIEEFFTKPSTKNFDLRVLGCLTELRKYDLYAATLSYRLASFAIKPVDAFDIDGPAFSLQQGMSPPATETPPPGKHD